MIISNDKLEKAVINKETTLLMDLVEKDVTYEISYLFDTTLSLITMTNIILVPLTGVNSAALKSFGYINAYVYSNIPGQEDVMSIYLVFERKKLEANSLLSFQINFYTDKLVKQYFLKEAIILQFSVEGYEKDINKCLDGKYSKISNKTKTVLTKNTYWLDYEKELPSPVASIVYPVEKIRSVVAKRLGISYPGLLTKDSEVFSLKYKEEETLFIKEIYLKDVLF